MNPTELIVEWLESDPAGRDDMGELESFSDLYALQESLESRIRKEGDLRRLRDDLIKVGTQRAPRDIGDLKGFLDWSLEQVDWQVVNHFVTDRNNCDVAPAASAEERAAP